MIEKSPLKGIFPLLWVLTWVIINSRFGLELPKKASQMNVTKQINLIKRVDQLTISLKQALIRNIFFMLPSLLTIPFYYLAFNNIEIVKINDLKGFATFIASSYPSQSIFSNGASIIIFIDLIFLIVDTSKKGKSLHDKLGKTYVIKYTLTN
ncbi:RDD family protein [Aquimarina celericrescens]|nr:RDD family protein [Aquimarina celericrescens]